MKIDPVAGNNTAIIMERVCERLKASLSATKGFDVHTILKFHALSFNLVKKGMEEQKEWIRIPKAREIMTNYCAQRSKCSDVGVLIVDGVMPEASELPASVNSAVEKVHVMLRDGQRPDTPWTGFLSLALWATLEKACSEVYLPQLLAKNAQERSLQDGPNLPPEHHLGIDLTVATEIESGAGYLPAPSIIGTTAMAVAAAELLESVWGVREHYTFEKAA